MKIFHSRMKDYDSYKRRRKAKGCVYTCLTGGYDKLPAQSCIDSEWDYICFTDDASLSKTMRNTVWEFRPLMYSSSDDVRNSRYHKLHPHEFLSGYENSIWMDSNVDVLTPYLFQVMDENADKRLLMPLHYKRECVYDEIAMIAARDLDDYHIVLKHREFLLKNGMPENYGLNETNVIYRKHHDPQIIRAMEDWWFFIENFSRRDQLSCSYVLFKHHISIRDVSFANVRRDRKNFRIGKHNRSLAQLYLAATGRIRRELIIRVGMRLPLKRASNRVRKTMDQSMKQVPLSGINGKQRTPKIIVSLTSFPERIREAHLAVYSLLTQTFKPDLLLLWLSDSEFPGGMKDLPASLLDLRKIGLEIRWCGNTRSYNKLIPALQEFPEDVIVTADDDLFYPADWLEQLYRSYGKNPCCAHAHRVRGISLDHQGNILQYRHWDLCRKGIKPSFLNFPTTGAGTLFPPGIFYPDVGKSDLFLRLCPNADDIWFWAMLTLNGKKTARVDSGMCDLTYINPDRELGLNSQKTLGKLNVHRGDNDMQFHNVILHYGVLRNYLTGERNVSLEQKQVVQGTEYQKVG